MPVECERNTSRSLADFGAVANYVTENRVSRTPPIAGAQLSRTVAAASFLRLFFPASLAKRETFTGARAPFLLIYDSRFPPRPRAAPSAPGFPDEAARSENLFPFLIPESCVSLVTSRPLYPGADQQLNPPETNGFSHNN